MAEETNIADNPDWFTASEEAKTATITQDFESSFASTDTFKKADPVTQDKYRLAHKQVVEADAFKSKYNPANIAAVDAQRKADNSGFFSNIGTKIVQGHEGAIGRVGMIDDAINADGIVDNDFAAQASKYYQKQNEHITTAAEKKLGQAVTRLQKRTDKDGFLNDAAAWGDFLIRDLPQNVAGVLAVAADSSSSITAMGMGAWGGAKVGAGVGTVLGGPAGTATGATLGAAGGMFTAEVMDAGSSKFLEQLRTRVEDAGLELTPSNIRMMMQDQAAVQKMQTDALTYGSVLGAVDVAMGGLFSKIATLPTKAARKVAVRSMGAEARAELLAVAKETGKPLKDLTEDMISGRTAKVLAGRSFKSKLKGGGASYIGEVAGEPASEAAATASIGEENTVENLVYETLGGIGAGPYGAAVNVAALGTKVGANRTGEFIKKIKDSTPETRAANKADKVEAQSIKTEQDPVIKAANKQRQAQSEVNYKKDVAATDISDPIIDKWADPADPDYNPIKAVETLAKAEPGNADAIDKANLVHDKFLGPIKENSAAMAELDIKIENQKAAGEPVSKADLARLDSLKATQKHQLETREIMLKSIDKMEAEAAKIIESKPVPDIDPKTATEETVTEHIIDTLGSHPKSVSNTKKLIDDPSTSPENKVLLQNVLDTQNARQSVSETAVGKKDMADVTNDIYGGMRGSAFRGIDSYQAGINNALNKNVNNLPAAKKELAGLKKFRDAHVLKSQRVSDLYATIKEKGEAGLSPEQRKTYAAMKVENKGFYISPASVNLVPAIEQEAAALNAEVKLAESKFKAHEAQTKANVKAEVKTSPEPKPVEPVTETKAPEVKPEPEVKPIEEKVTPEQKPIEETKPSTTEDITDNVPDDVPDTLEQYVNTDFGQLPIEVGKDDNGNPIMKPFDTFVAEIDSEINEAQSIIDCCNTKKG